MQRSIGWATFVLSLVLAVAGCSNGADPGAAATSPPWTRRPPSSRTRMSSTTVFRSKCRR